MKVILPQSAVDLLKDVISDRSDEPATIRVYFVGFGCCGASFGIALDKKSEQDFEYNIKGLCFIMNKDEYDKYGDITISEVGEGFVISVERMPEGGGNCGTCSGCR
ncbi:Fe-S cluster assembly protein HesB [Romboutsia sp.]|uniref:Fe-S cluster assembly protein HesB n=1 Tax=Romboutsia sp. TaxID=1965302 RepID=UPI003F407DF7